MLIRPITFFIYSSLFFFFKLVLFIYLTASPPGCETNLTTQQNDVYLRKRMSLQPPGQLQQTCISVIYEDKKTKTANE